MTKHLLSINELRKKERAELISELTSLKRAYMHLRFRKRAAELSDTSQIKKVKKRIARVNTVFLERFK